MRLVILEYDDWEWGYINGKIFAEGHSVKVEEVLQALADQDLHTVDEFTYKMVYLDDHMGDEEEVADYCWNANSLSDWPEEVQEAAR